jgi:hypothetical protein
MGLCDARAADVDIVDGVRGAIVIVANKSSARVTGSDCASANAQAAGLATAVQSPLAVPRDTASRLGAWTISSIS